MEGIQKNWSIFLSVGAAACYIVGYIKAVALTKAIYLSAVPLEIYNSVDLFGFGATFFATVLTVPTLIFFTIYALNYLGCGSSNSKIKMWFSKKYRFYLWGTLIVMYFIALIIFRIPGGTAILPLLLIIKKPIFGICLIVILILFTLLCFWVVQNISGIKRWICLGVGLFVWSLVMLLIQTAMYSTTIFENDYPIDTQRPGIVGTLTIKDNIKQSVPSFEFSEGYMLNGVLLSKSDKFYYFAVFPRDKSNVSNLYMFPIDRVIAFNTSILLLKN